MVAQLSADERRRGVVTYSSGNHGQAVALAARDLGAPAVVVMPTTAPAIKVEGAKRSAPKSSWKARRRWIGGRAPSRRPRAAA